MVTFRNNNNNKRNTFRRNNRTFKSNSDNTNLLPIFQIMIILKENPQEEIIIMPKIN